MISHFDASSRTIYSCFIKQCIEMYRQSISKRIVRIYIMFASTITTPLAYMFLICALCIFIMSPRLVVCIHKADEMLIASQQLLLRWGYLYCVEVFVALCSYMSLVLLGIVVSLPFITAIFAICATALVLSCLLSQYV